MYMTLKYLRTNGLVKQLAQVLLRFVHKCTIATAKMPHNDAKDATTAKLAVYARTKPHMQKVLVQIIL